MPTGTYYVSISSDYALTRDDIVITMGNENIDNVVIPIIACDYNQDASITVADTGYVFTNMSKDAPAFDLNGDDSVTVADSGYVYSCIGGKYDGFDIK